MARLTQLAPACRLTYAPQGPTLREFHRNSEMFGRVLIGPLGSGKTQACIFEVLHCIDNQTPDKHGRRRSRWVAARNTYIDLMNTTIKDWREITDAMPGSTWHNGPPPHWKCDYYKPDGTRVVAEVLFLAFDRAEDAKKARGQQLSGLWGNELKELHIDNWDMLQGRVTRYPPKAEVPGAKFHCIADSNAPDRDHWLGKQALENTPDGWWFGVQPGGLMDVAGKFVRNPQAENRQNLQHNYYTQLAAGKKESFIRANLCNEFVFHSSGQPVHKDFNEQLHTGECEPKPGRVLTVGIDFGRTPAATVSQKQDDGTWQTYHELVTTNTAAKEFGELLRDFMNEKYPHYVVDFIGDPAGDDQAQTRDETPFDMLLLSGIICVEANTNDFGIRTAALDNILTKLINGKPAYRVHPRCTTLIRGLAGAYQFKRVAVAGADRFRNEPDKGPESHVCESLHYGLLGGGAGVALYDQVAQNAFKAPKKSKKYYE